jgi:hypothetical protein
MRPRIDTAAIDPEHVGAAIEPGRERCLGKAVAENAARRQQPKFLHLGFLLRSRWREASMSGPGF